ncbi:MauE/DoxX family redox-associated membrane protein [Amycolatopsis azurea]
MYLSTACAAALTLVFVVSVTGKFGGERFRSFVASTGVLGVISRARRVIVARMVVAAEFVIVAALIAGAVGRWWSVLFPAFAGAASLLVAFTAAIVLSLSRGERAPCHCFGPSASPLGVAQVVRNILLLGIALSGSVASSVESPHGHLPGTAVALCAGLAVGLVAVRFDDIVELFRDVPELVKE